MIKPVETAVRVAALVLAGIFLAGAASDRFALRRTAAPAAGSGAADRVRHFHPGKSREPQAPDGACQSRGCHGESPHRKNRAMAAFLNMHGRSVECFACHGRDAENAWRGGARGGGGRKILNPLPGGKVDPHTLFGNPVSCRQCHSDGGRARLTTRGVLGLPEGFSDPIPIRMMERGAKRWDPAEIR